MTSRLLFDMQQISKPRIYRQFDVEPNTESMQGIGFPQIVYRY